MTMKRVISLLLTLVILIPLTTSCNFFGKDSETAGETNEGSQRTGPCLFINGVDISEFEILKEADEFEEIYQEIQAAIYSFCGVELPITEASDCQYLIRIVEDFSLEPNESCIRVVNDELRLGVFSYSFTKAVAAARDLLLNYFTDHAVLEWDDHFYEVSSFEMSVISHNSPKLTETLVLYGGSDRDSLSYVDEDPKVRTKDDKIVFRLACIAGDQLVGVPWIQYKIYDEATGKTESGWADASSGTVAFTVKTSGKAGVVYLDATLCNESKEKLAGKIATIDDCHFKGSAVVNLNDITMSVDVPDDFDAFWQSQVKDLYSSPIEILKMTSKTTTQKGFRLFYVELKCNVYSGETDGIVSGYLTYPTNASSTDPIDLRVAYKGYAFAPSEPVYVANTATFSVCAHSIDCERANKDSAYLKQQESKDTIYDDPSNSNRETVYFRGMILRDLQAARFMVEYFGEKGIGDGKGKGMWNGENFTANGGSQGAFQSIAVAALDQNITCLDISIPWMCDIKCANGRKKGASLSYQDALEYYDTTSFAHLIRCKTSISVSMGDDTAPISGVISFYNALTCEKQLSCFQNASHSVRLQSRSVYRLFSEGISA